MVRHTVGIAGTALDTYHPVLATAMGHRPLPFGTSGLDSTWFLKSPLPFTAMRPLLAHCRYRAHQIAKRAEAAAKFGRRPIVYDTAVENLSKQDPHGLQPRVSATTSVPAEPDGSRPSYDQIVSTDSAGHSIYNSRSEVPVLMGRNSVVL